MANSPTAHTYSVQEILNLVYDPSTGVLKTTGGSGTNPTIGGTVTGGTAQSVLYVDSSGFLAQDNNQFYFNPVAVTGVAYAILSVGTNGDFTGTDSVSIYNQFDAYNPNSIINGGSGQAANLLLDGVIPGLSVSSSRGTGTSPTNMNTGDFVGTVTGYGYTNSGYQASTSMLTVMRGSTSTNLGAELQFWTKADGGSLAQNMTLANNGFLGIGQVTPTALLDIAGGASAAAWTTNGIGLRVESATYTDTTSTGTVPQLVMYAIGQGTVVTSNTTTYSTAFGVFLNTSPIASTNVTFGQTSWALGINGNTLIAGASSNLFIITNNAVSQSIIYLKVSSATTGYVGIGTGPSAKLHIAGNDTAAAWTTNGIGLRIDAATYTDSTSSGTVSQVNVHNIASATIAASTTTTYTSAIGLVVTNPTAGTNVTISGSYASLFNGRTYIASNSSDAFIVSSSFGSTPALAVGTTIGGSVSIGSSVTGNSKFTINGSVSTSAWTTTGVIIALPSLSLTDTSSSGTVTAQYDNVFSGNTIVASSVTTYTDYATIFVGSPTASTNVTMTNQWAILTPGDIKSFKQQITQSLSIGTSGLGGVQFLTIGSTTRSGGAWLLGGLIQVGNNGQTYSDTTSSGTVAGVSVMTLGTTSIAASSATTYTIAANLYIAAAPTAGTNATLTNAYALYVAAGNSAFIGGITVGTAAQIISSNTSLTNGAGVGVGTLTTAPTAGNPTKWIGINDNGTTRYVPAW